MVELSVVLALAALGLGFVLWLVRFWLGEPLVDTSLAQAVAPLARVADAFLSRASSAAAVLSGLLAGGVFLGYGLLRPPAKPLPVSLLELGVWLSVSLALGAGSTLATAKLATSVATRAGAQVALGAKRSLDHALQAAMRAASVPATLGATLTSLSVCLLFGASFAVHGGFGADPSLAYRLVPFFPMLVAGFPLGSAFAALSIHLATSTFAKSSDMAADIAARESELDEDDPRNPGVILDLAGDAASGVGGRGATLAAASTVDLFAVLWATTHAFAGDPSFGSAIAMLFLPLLVRGFGVLAAMFGAMVVRTDGREDPMSALSRGLWVTAALSLTGLAGTAEWILGPRWLWFVAAGALGVLLSAALLHLSLFASDPRHRAARELADLSRLGPSVGVLRGLSLGLEGAVLPGLLVALVSYLSHELGVRSGVARGGALGMGMATLGMLGVGAYAAACDALGPIADLSRGLVEHTTGAERPEERGRALVLDSIGSSLAVFARHHGAATAALASLLGAEAIAVEAQRHGGAEGLTVRLGPEVLLAASAGALLVSWTAATVIKVVVRAGRRLLDEVRRQLRDGDGTARPRFEVCFEIATGLALRAMVLPGVVVIATPFALALALRLIRGGGRGWQSVEALTALPLAATVAGVLGTLIVGAAGGAWGNAKRYVATGAHGGVHTVHHDGVRSANPVYVATSIGDEVGDPLKDTVAPALHVVVKLLPAALLVFLPFLF